MLSATERRVRWDVLRLSVAVLLRRDLLGVCGFFYGGVYIMKVRCDLLPGTAALW